MSQNKQTFFWIRPRRGAGDRVRYAVVIVDKTSPFMMLAYGDAEDVLTPMVTVYRIIDQDGEGAAKVWRRLSGNGYLPSTPASPAWLDRQSPVGVRNLQRIADAAESDARSISLEPTGVSAAAGGRQPDMRRRAAYEAAIKEASAARDVAEKSAIAAYEAVIKQLSAAYEAVTKPARAARAEAIESAWANYSIRHTWSSSAAARDEAIRSAQVAYDKAAKPAQSAYNKAVQPAQVAYDKAIRLAGTAYEAAVDQAVTAYKAAKPAAVDPLKRQRAKSKAARAAQRASKRAVPTP